VPLVACPKCSTNLRVPDGPVPAIRCPKCQTIFQPPKATQPAFEVIDEEPVVEARPAPVPPRPAPAKAAPPKSGQDFDVVDDEKPRSSVGKALSLDDDEDDRPRGRRSRDEDDDDRPRSRKRSRDYDDEDDEDDRPRKRRKGRRDDEDDEPRPKAARGSLGIARAGLLLILISLGLYLAGISLHLLFLFIAWLGGSIPNGLILMTGLFGLANWIVALVGLGMSIAGPSRSRGLAIAAISVAVAHLILAFVVANNRDSIPFSSNSILVLSYQNRVEAAQDLQKELKKEIAKDANSQRVKDLREELRSRREDARDAMEDTPRLTGMRWHDMTTMLPQLDKLIAVLSYSSKEFDEYLLSMFAGVAELARLILVIMVVGSLAAAAKDHGGAEKAKIGWISAAIASGVGMLVVLLVAVILDSYASDFKKAVTGGLSSPPEMPRAGGNFQEWRQQQEQWAKDRQSEAEKMQEKFRSLQRGIKNWHAGGEFLIYLIHGGVLVLPALAALSAYSSSSRRR
jgi:hypothetical protein